MRGAFIYYKKISNKKLTGIDKKVMWQIDNFNINSLNCNLVIMNKSYKCLFLKLLTNLLAIFPYGNTLPNWKYDNQFLYMDYIYMRRPSAYTYNMIRVLKKIKKNNPNIKIVLEIPTYPYDKELLINMRYLPLYIKDLYNRKKLVQVIDRIAIQNEIDEIFGISTIKFTNGIKVNDISLRNPNEKNYSIINICAVASLEPWDGYERIIKGLRTYICDGGDRIVKIHIVGEGKEKKYYEALVEKFDLKNNVIFYGRKTGDELAKIYDLCDLSLDVFGMYKKNNNTATSLKSREYLAKGLPIIIGCEVDIISAEFPYHLKFFNDDSEINIIKIIEFYDEIYNRNTSKISVANEIRDYAYKVCDISKSMSSIINYLKS